jgi:hypothetical protein
MFGGETASGSHTRRWLMHYQAHGSDDGSIVIRQKKKGQNKHHY